MVPMSGAGSGEGMPVCPGSAAAEAAADALLMRAKACGVRVARVLLAAARGRTKGAGLRRAAGAILLSCAYTTERGLRKRHQMVVPSAEELGGACGAVTWRQPARDWLALAISAHPEALAESVGLSGRQAQVWVARARGESISEIAAELGVGRAAVYRHLARAQARARQSWLAAYWESLGPNTQ